MTDGTTPRFFRLFYAANPDPLAVTTSAGFDEGDHRGTLLTDAGALITDAKIAALCVLDDSASIAWADPADQRGARLSQLLTQLWGRTQKDLGAGTFYPSHADLWAFGTALTERTRGFTSDITALTTLAQATYERGTRSDLGNTLEIAMGGLSPQSIVDAILVDGNEPLAQQNVQTVVDYLAGIGALGLQSLRAWHSAQPVPSAWQNGSPSTRTLTATIKDYADVRERLIQRWAASFTPAAFVLADGDSDPQADLGEIGESSRSAWNDGPVPVFAYGVGTGSQESGLHSLVSGAGMGRFVLVSDTTGTTDWDAARTSYLHGGANSLFTAGWQNAFDFTEAVWLRSVLAEFTGDVTAEFRISRDRVSFTPWRTLGSLSPVTINDKVLVIEYRATLRDTWNGSRSVAPVLTRLEHVTVVPSRRILVSAPQPASGMLFEYLASASQNLPASAQAQWGVARGDTTDWADFEPIRIGRKGALPNRQQSLQFTKEVTRSLLKTTTVDNLAFQVFEDSGAVARWSEGDVVQVIAQDIIISPNTGTYALDGARGILYFTAEQPGGLDVRVTITTPPHLYTGIGEPATSLDGRTFFLQNGRFPADSVVVVLSNGAIVRGGYSVAPEEGTITFTREQERTALITVYVQPPAIYRVGVDVLSYDGSQPVVLDNFGMEYTTRKNTNLLYLAANTPTPSVSSVRLLPSWATIYDRVTVDYQFAQIEGNQEKGTTIDWFRSTDSGNTYLPLDGDGGRPDYTNRITIPLADVGAGGTFAQGNRAYVVVTPSDGIGIGPPVKGDVLGLFREQDAVCGHAGDYRGSGKWGGQRHLLCPCGPGADCGIQLHRS